jgi:hypothetical protein
MGTRRRPTSPSSQPPPGTRAGDIESAIRWKNVQAWARKPSSSVHDQGAGERPSKARLPGASRSGGDKRPSTPRAATRPRVGLATSRERNCRRTEALPRQEPARDRANPTRPHGLDRWCVIRQSSQAVCVLGFDSVRSRPVHDRLPARGESAPSTARRRAASPATGGRKTRSPKRFTAITWNRCR